MTVKVDFNIPLATGIALAAAEKGVRAATEEARNITVLMLSQPGSGRLYQRGKTVEHRASAPGEPPAPDTGLLRSRIETEIVRGPSEVVGIVTANTEYAAHLEFGTERMKPRPFLSRLAGEYAGRLRAVFAQFAKD